MEYQGLAYVELAGTAVLMGVALSLGVLAISRRFAQAKGTRLVLPVGFAGGVLPFVVGWFTHFFASEACALLHLLGGGGGVERIAMARNYGYIEIAMLISVADAKNQLSQLIRAVEDGEEVIITRSGKPVAQLTPAPTGTRKVRLGTMRNRIVLKPGWDAPITEEQFFKGEF